MTWNTTTMATIAMTTGRTPLSPARIRATYARTYSPSDCATTSGGSSATAASGAAAVRSAAALPVSSAFFSGSATGAAKASCSHVLDDALTVELRRGVLHHEAAEVHHRDAVGDLEDVVQVVGDHHHGKALVTESPDEVQHHLGLDDAKRRRGLVHDHQLGVPHDGFRHGHRLPLAAGEGCDRLADGPDGRDAKARQRLARGTLHRVFVEEPGAQPLAAQEHVLHDVQVVGQREVLVDGLDAKARGVAGVVDVDRAALPEELAVVRLVDSGDALGKDRLAGAVVSAQGCDLSRWKVEIDVKESLYRAEVLVQVLDSEQRLIGRVGLGDGSRHVHANYLPGEEVTPPRVAAASGESVTRCRLPCRRRL